MLDGALLVATENEEVFEFVFFFVGVVAKVAVELEQLQQAACVRLVNRALFWGSFGCFRALLAVLGLFCRTSERSTVLLLLLSSHPKAIC